MDGPGSLTLAGEDGRLYRCRVQAWFPFGTKEYALLLHEDDEGGMTTVVMQMLEGGGGEAIFRPIEDEEEFRSVVAYIREATSPDEPEDTRLGVDSA